MYFLNEIIEGNNDKTTAMEATFVYHLIKEGQSFQSAICTSQLIREVFGPNSNFKCGETKSEAIATSKCLFSNYVMFYSVSTHKSF